MEYRVIKEYGYPAIIYKLQKRTFGIFWVTIKQSRIKHFVYDLYNQLIKK